MKQWCMGAMIAVIFFALGSVTSAGCNKRLAMADSNGVPSFIQVGKEYTFSGVGSGTVEEILDGGWLRGQHMVDGRVIATFYINMNTVVGVALD